ncbi:class I SAM-dependent methyltransferase [Bacillus tianshenii]|nr:class I SAM-dependent methyltransferase [Bacillus tianshenii]
MTTNKYIDMLAFFGVHGAHPGGMALTQQLLDEIELTPTSDVLDAGCGIGETARFLAENFDCHIHALDHHPGMIEKAKQMHSDVNPSIYFCEGNVEDLPFKPNSFDLILSESTAAFTNQPVTAQEFYRVLKPGGSLLAIEMTALHPEPTLELRYQEFYGITKLLTAKQWIDLWRQTGFSDVQASRVPVLPSTYTAFTPDQHIPDQYMDLLQQHQELQLAHSEKISGYIYRAKKSVHA